MVNPRFYQVSNLKIFHKLTLFFAQQDPKTVQKQYKTRRSSSPSGLFRNHRNLRTFQLDIALAEGNQGEFQRWPHALTFPSHRILNRGNLYQSSMSKRTSDKPWKPILTYGHDRITFPSILENNFTRKKHTCIW